MTLAQSVASASTYARDSASTSSRRGRMIDNRRPYTSSSGTAPRIASVVNARTLAAVASPRRAASQSIPSMPDTVESTSSTTVLNAGASVVLTTDLQWLWLGDQVV